RGGLHAPHAGGGRRRPDVRRPLLPPGGLVVGGAGRGEPRPGPHPGGRLPPRGRLGGPPRAGGGGGGRREEAPLGARPGQRLPGRSDGAGQFGRSLDGPPARLPPLPAPAFPPRGAWQAPPLAGARPAAVALSWAAVTAGAAVPARETGPFSKGRHSSPGQPRLSYLVGA